MRAFFILFFMLNSARALAVEGSSYFLRQSFAVTDTTCSQALDPMAKLLFGSKQEHRGLAMYSSIICGTDPERPLQVEVFFEPASEEQRAELEDWMSVLEQSAWRGEPLRLQFVNTIFWNTYGYAPKADGTLASSFEKPRVAGSFGAILAEKNRMKSILEGASLTDFQALLGEQIGEKELSRWKKEVLPLANQIDFSLYLYFLTAGDQAEKSSIVYQLSRNCVKLGCR